MLKRCTFLCSVFFFPMVSQAGKLELNEEAVSHYVDGAVHGTEAINAGSIDELPSYQRKEFHKNVSDVFNEHAIYDQHDDHTYADEQLEHFITTSQSYTLIENSTRLELASHAHSHNYYDTLYAQRLEHIEGCWICNRFLRRICVNTPIQPLLFNPEYAYYRGQRYSAENGYLSYENRSIQIDYDYEADAWYFGNRENQLYWY